MKNKLLFFFPLLLILLGCSNDMETTKEVTSEVLLFEFTPDTGRNSSNLHYEIKYTNPNDFAIKGYSSITMDYNGLILTPIKRLPLDTYIEIGSNSTYTEVYNVETPHDTELLSPEQIQSFYVNFVSVKFTIVE
jgi:hypothetical protein